MMSKGKKKECDVCLYIYIYIYIYFFFHVESGFDGEEGTHTKLVPVKSVVKKLEEKKDKQKERPVNFLNRESNSTAVSSWRPLKVHRGHAKNWCRAVDRQFRISTSMPGLNFFRPPGYRCIVGGPHTMNLTVP